jgi:hypothetical protein
MLILIEALAAMGTMTTAPFFRSSSIKTTENQVSPLLA